MHDSSELFRAGNLSLTTTLVKLLSDSTPLSNGVMLRAHINNVPDILIKPNAQGSGYILEPGEEFLLRVDQLSKVWVQATGAGACILSWLAI